MNIFPQKIFWSIEQMNKNLWTNFIHLNKIKIMNTSFCKLFLERGLTAASASRISGIPYVTILQHIKGTRGVSPELAKQYEKLLGIPKSKIRPDLWPPEQPEPVKAD